MEFSRNNIKHAIFVACKILLLIIAAATIFFLTRPYQQLTPTYFYCITAIYVIFFLIGVARLLLDTPMEDGPAFSTYHYFVTLSIPAFMSAASTVGDKIYPYPDIITWQLFFISCLCLSCFYNIRKDFS